MMNSYITEQLGIVLGLTRTSEETIDAAREPLHAVWNSQHTLDIYRAHQQISDRVERLAVEQQSVNAVFQHGQDSQSRMDAMRDYYISHNWDNVREVLYALHMINATALLQWRILQWRVRGLRTTAAGHLSRDGLMLQETFHGEIVDALRELERAQIPNIPKASKRESEER